MKLEKKKIDASRLNCRWKVEGSFPCRCRPLDHHYICSARGVQSEDLQRFCGESPWGRRTQFLAPRLSGQSDAQSGEDRGSPAPRETHRKKKKKGTKPLRSRKCYGHIQQAPDPTLGTILGAITNKEPIRITRNWKLTDRGKRSLNRPFPVLDQSHPSPWVAYLSLLPMFFFMAPAVLAGSIYTSSFKPAVT